MRPCRCCASRGGEGRARFFHALLGPLGADRSIYAPDLPGCGESDSAGADAGPEQYALALTDLLDSLRQREVDVLAHAEGVETAIAMEKLRPHCTAPAPGVHGAHRRGRLSRLRSLNLSFRELPLAAANPNAASAGPDGVQITDLIDYFGTAKPV